MIIKAKYPALYRPYMQDVYQGYGGLSGGQNDSVLTQVDSREFDGQIHNSSTAYMFGGGKVFVYTNTNSGSSLIFVNESIFIVDNSTSSITEIDTEIALEFINESDWAPESTPDYIDVLIASLKSRSDYFENESPTRELLTNLQNCINE